MILTKSVTTPIDRDHDGLRILAARFRGRGLPTSAYDVWMPSLGPSAVSYTHLTLPTILRV